MCLHILNCCGLAATSCGESFIILSVAKRRSVLHYRAPESQRTELQSERTQQFLQPTLSSALSVGAELADLSFSTRGEVVKRKCQG